MDSPLIPFLVTLGVWQLATYCRRNRKHYEVSKVIIYPIKSCKGIELQKAEISRTGFKYDRAFVIVDADNNFVTQRKYSRMALIETNIDFNRNMMELSAPGMNKITINLNYASDNNATRTETVTVWKIPCEAFQAGGEEASQWINEFLHTKGLRIMRMAKNFIRKTDPDFAPKGQTAFADGFPFLLASEASLTKLNQTLPAPITMERFRPNIIVKNCAAYDEDSWKQVLFSSVTMNVVKPCSRCAIPDVDPDTGVMDPNHLVSRELQNIRSGKHRFLFFP
jgi:uncharacterized protein YcbX